MIASFSIGCIPNYSSIGINYYISMYALHVLSLTYIINTGWIATFLLIVCRIIQGIAAGGEMVGAFIYTIEGVETYTSSSISSNSNSSGSNSSGSNKMNTPCNGYSNIKVPFQDVNGLNGEKKVGVSSRSKSHKNEVFGGKGFWGACCKATGNLGLTMGKNGIPYI